VSVGLPAALDYPKTPAGVPALDGFPHSFEPSHTFDENAVSDFFDLSRFDETETTQGFFNNSFVPQDSANPYGLGDSFDAKHFDLQTDSGATNLVSDETGLAAEDV